MKKLIGLLLILILILIVGTQNGFISIPSLQTPILPKITDQENKVINNNKILSEESTIISVIEKSIPSVVTISISKTTIRGGGIEINPFDFQNPFRQRESTQETIEQNIGSGFIISDDGLIATNKHVVSDEDAEYKVITNDNKTYDIKKISKDPLNDLAILQIDAKNLKPLELGDSSNLKLGQLVIAIGTPLGEFTNSVTSGIISGLGRGIVAGSPYESYVERLDNVIQTDAAISPGNSGGPLIASNGTVIGINTAVSSEGQNIGFAIPVNVIKDLISKYDKNSGIIKRPFLGIRYQLISKESALLNEVPEGALILEVVENSTAEKAGLKKNDIITKIDGKKINGTDTESVQKIISNKNVGEKITIEYFRDNKKSTISVILQAP